MLSFETCWKHLANQLKFSGGSYTCRSVKLFRWYLVFLQPNLLGEVLGFCHTEKNCPGLTPIMPAQSAASLRSRVRVFMMKLWRRRQLLELRPWMKKHSNLRKALLKFIFKGAEGYGCIYTLSKEWPLKLRKFFRIFLLQLVTNTISSAVLLWKARKVPNLLNLLTWCHNCNCMSRISNHSPDVLKLHIYPSRHQRRI